MKEIFKSDRYFTLFDVIVSHGQMLLRSQKSDELVSNIDIIFFNTVYVQTFTRLKGIKISRVKDKDVLNYKTVEKYLAYDGNYLFEIESNDEKYYVAASFFKVFENQFDFSESSLNLSYKGVEIQNSFEV